MSEWTYFNRYDFKCKCGCGFNNIDTEFVDKLNEAREIAGVPFVITSGCRCRKHNAAVSTCGDPLDSPHLKGVAADIAIQNSIVRYLVLTALVAVGFTRIGIGRNFIHVDMDDNKPPKVIWNNY
jgi:uncharacterized protein YcbK (DUF882 family)